MAATDLFGIDVPDHHADPYGTYRRLREEDPVRHSNSGPWMVFRHEDVVRAARELSSDERHARDTARNAVLVDSYGPGFYDWPRLQRCDAPDHTRMRRALSRPFTPRQIERLRAGIITRVDALIDGLTQSRIELMTDLARPLAYDTIIELLGLPVSGDEELLVDCLAKFTGANMEPTPTHEQVEMAKEALATLQRDLSSLVELKRSNRGDDLTSELLAAQDEGRMDEAEVLMQVQLMFSAGHMTTVASSALALLAILTHRDQWDRLVEEPDLARDATDELLRFDATVQLVWRQTITPWEAGGVEIPAGCHVLGWIGSANRDELRWGPTAETLDISRENVREHVAFGYGPHLCLGANLARLEIETLLHALVTRFPKTVVANRPVDWDPHLALRSPKALYLDLEG